MDTFTGAYATPDLIGRVDILANIATVLEQPTKGPKVVFLTGKGGMGKTRLLLEILRRASKFPDIKVAKGLIDFYHMLMHTPDGLARALFEVLTPPIEDFRNYDGEYQALERRRLTGEVSRVTVEQREQALNSFSKDMSILSTRHRVVIALDTAEKAIYGTTEADEKAESWRWLLDEALPVWGDVVLFIAGRPESAPLGEELRKKFKENFTLIKVDKFEEEDSLRYFDAAAKVARENKQKDIAERIEAWPDEFRRVAHIYTDGQPILLALLIDNQFSERPIPGLLSDPISEARLRTQEEKQHIRDKLAKVLIERLREAPGGLGDTIIALGRVEKGADTELLARLLGVSPYEAQVMLEKVKRFSFVKTRRKDDRVFLHDEMYTLLKQWVYTDPADGQQAVETAKKILAYYHDVPLKHCHEELDMLYAPVEEGRKNTLDFESLSIENAKRRAALVELVYYRLRQNPTKGYMRFYRYVREATLSGDSLLEMQLRAELMAFMAEKDSQGQVADLDGLDRELVDWSIAIRPVTQAWSSQQYQKVLDEVRRIQERASQLPNARAPISLQNWEAYALIYLGGEENLHKARVKLDNVIKTMEAEHKSGSGALLSPARKWRDQAVLAFAYRVRGYLHRVRGQMEAAVNDYRHAAAFFRQINLQIELATTLNDMGFAMAELGYWSDARSLVNDALGLRRRLGPRVPVGLSLNTLAMIDLREGNYEAAIINAEKALALFRALEDRRRAGLALTALAEAQRRYSGLLSDADEKVKLLREARDQARTAHEIFEEVEEKYRQVEALIEEGCACRDWVKVRIMNPSARDDTGRLFYESRDALRKAADLASSEILYKKIDALVDLAWLGFFAKDIDTLKDAALEILEDAASEAEQSVDDSYKIEKTGRPQISKEDAQILIWPQLGKLRILYGHRAFKDYYGDQEKNGETHRSELISKLKESVNYYYWGLEYSTLYSPDYQRLRLAKDEIYIKLRQLHDDELQIVASVVEDNEGKFGQSDSVMKEFLRRRALWYGKG